MKLNQAQSLVSVPFLTREKGFSFDKTQEKSLIIEYSHIVEAVFRYLEEQKYALNPDSKDDNNIQSYQNIYLFLAHIRQNKSLSSAQTVGASFVGALTYLFIIGLIIGAGFLITTLELHMLSFLVVFTAVAFSFALHYLLNKCVQKIEAPSKQDNEDTQKYYDQAIVATEKIKNISVLEVLLVKGTTLSKSTFILFNNPPKDSDQVDNSCLYKIETRSNSPI